MIADRMRLTTGGLDLDNIIFALYVNNADSTLHATAVDMVSLETLYDSPITGETNDQTGTNGSFVDDEGTLWFHNGSPGVIYKVTIQGVVSIFKDTTRNFGVIFRRDGFVYGYDYNSRVFVKYNVDTAAEVATISVTQATSGFYAGKYDYDKNRYYFGANDGTYQRLKYLDLATFTEQAPYGLGLGTYAQSQKSFYANGDLLANGTNSKDMVKVILATPTTTIFATETNNIKGDCFDGSNVFVMVTSPTNIKKYANTTLVDTDAYTLYGSMLDMFDLKNVCVPIGHADYTTYWAIFLMKWDKTTQTSVAMKQLPNAKPGVSRSFVRHLRHS